jgi:HK97 family phage portal protein
MKKLFQKLFSGKASTASTFTYFSQLGRAVPAPKDIESYSREGYAKCVVAYRGVNLIADAISSYKFNLYEQRGDEKIQIFNHPIIDLLKNPNPVQSRETFIKFMVSFYAIAGNTYIEEVNTSRNADNPPDELWILYPQYMKIAPGQFAVPSAYVHKIGTNERKWEVDIMGRSQILHVKTFNPLNRWYGLSPLEPARYEIDQYNEGNVWNLSLLKNGARPSGAIVYKPERGDGKLLKEQRDQIKSDLAEMSGSVSGRVGMPMVLDGGMDFKEFGMNMKDMDFVKNKEVTAKDVGQALGVPGQLIGIKDAQTYNNYEQAKMAFHVDTALPIGKTVVGQFNKMLVPKYGNPNLFIEIDEDEIPALEQLRKERFEKYDKATFLSPNEKRDATGYSPYAPTGEPGDSILVNASQIALEDITDIGSEPLTDTEDVTGSEDNDDEKTLPGSPVFKQINIESDRAKRQLFNSIVRKRLKFERTFAIQMAAALRKQGEEMAKNVEGVSNELAPFVVATTLEDTKDDLFKVLKRNIRAVAEEFGEDTLAIAKSCPDHFDTKQEDFLAGPRGKFHTFLDEWVDEEAARQVSLINKTTKKRITKAIREAIADHIEAGEAGEVALSKTIQKTYRGFTNARARTIARTEVHTASNVASREAARALSIPNLQKEWLSDLSDTARGLDENDSTNHISMNGEKVDIDEKFSVFSDDGNDDMDGPGDPSAPADQIINCKCTLIYSTPKGDE